jgi:hypothetical protein
MAWQSSPEIDTWRVGDWLINYSGGPVRRGLSGFLVFHIWRNLDANPLWVIATIQCVAYGLYFLFSYRLKKGDPKPKEYLFLTFSSFIFAFQLHDPQGGFRKEILVYLLLGWLTLEVRRHGAATLFRQGVTSIIMMPLLILTHEVMAIAFPYVLLLLMWGQSCSVRRYIFRALALSVPSAVALLMAFHWKSATYAEVASICASWGGMHLTGACMTGQLHGWALKATMVLT